MPQPLGYENGLIVGFEPRFRSLDDDHERYLFALVDLADAGVIERKPGEPLIGYAEKASEWLLERYFEKGLLDAIERHHLADEYTFFGPPHAMTQDVIDRFDAMGQTERVKRLWRSHIGLLRHHYWEEMAFAAKGPDKPLYGETQAEADASHARMLARLAERKPILIDQMRRYRAWLADLPGTGAEIERLDLAIAEVETGKRHRPAAKPDPRTMDEALFWEIIETGLPGESETERLDRLPERLAAFKPAAIRTFAEILRDKGDAAYRTDVWALVYLLRGGCSDDAFDGFRGWLILQGREVFDRTLADPDGFDPAGFHDAEIMGLQGAVDIAYEMRTGKVMRPLKRRARPELDPEPDESRFPELLPRIAEFTGDA